MNRLKLVRKIFGTDDAYLVERIEVGDVGCIDELNSSILKAYYKHRNKKFDGKKFNKI